METYNYFQNKPVGEKKGAYALGYKDAEDLIKQIVCVNPETDDIDTDEVRILNTSNFSNGVNVTIEAQEWVVKELRKRFEIRQQQVIPV